MIKHKFLSLIVVFTFYILNFAFVYAHILKSDGSIGAILHVNPDDDPIAGFPAGLFFEFKDKENKFDLVSCDCTFAVYKENREIYSQPLYQNNPSPNLTNASVSYTFPEKNIYQVKVSGKPLTGGAFQPFNLGFDVRVAKDKNETTSGQDQNWFEKNPLTLLAGTVFIIIGAFLIRKRKEVD